MLTIAGRGLQRLKLPANSVVVRALLEEADVDNDGEIDLKDFKKFVRRREVSAEQFRLVYNGSEQLGPLLSRSALSSAPDPLGVRGPGPRRRRSCNLRRRGQDVQPAGLRAAPGGSRCPCPAGPRRNGQLNVC